MPLNHKQHPTMRNKNSTQNSCKRRFAPCAVCQWARGKLGARANFGAPKSPKLHGVTHHREKSFASSQHNSTSPLFFSCRTGSARDRVGLGDSGGGCCGSSMRRKAFFKPVRKISVVFQRKVQACLRPCDTTQQSQRVRSADYKQTLSQTPRLFAIDNCATGRNALPPPPLAVLVPPFRRCDQQCAHNTEIGSVKCKSHCVCVCGSERCGWCSFLGPHFNF